MTLRACLRLLLLAAMLLAPLGRLGVAQAMAAPAGMNMAHCAEMPAPAAGHHRKAPAPSGEKMAVDCMIACAAMAAAPAPFIAPPPPPAAARPASLFLSSLTGIQPEADPPPPRIS